MEKYAQKHGSNEGELDDDDQSISAQEMAKRYVLL